MLTDSEKRWLRSREPTPMAYCVWCRKCDLDFKTHSFRQCPTDYAPADDFEARVAAKLARISFERGGAYPCRHGMPAFGCMRDKTSLTGPFAVHCEDCLLREVRIAIEEEMDE